jgi:hypothetical protein
MFVEEVECLDESGLEESDFDIPEGAKLAEVSVRTLKPMRVFLAQDIIFN